MDKIHQNLENFFPGAKPYDQVLDTCYEKMKKEWGMDPCKTIAAVSLCPDELNNPVIEKITTYFGSYFQLGGLTGYPFTGETGFNAFGDHIPDRGAAFIFFGPHMGVDDHQLGLVRRHGQKRETLSCGSAMGAYRSLTCGMDPSLFPATDFQQAQVRQMLARKLDNIPELYPEPSVMNILIDESHSFIVRQARRIKEKFEAETIFLLGAFILNTPSSMPDFLQVKYLEMI